MRKIYRVPLVAQTTPMSCWHASALMLWYYWQGVTSRQGPMNTLANNYLNDTGVHTHEFADLASKVGLKRVSQHYPYYNSLMLCCLLTLYGPLWCDGLWFGPRHIIVLTGVDEDTIYLNDPDKGVAKQKTVKWFNEKLGVNYNTWGCIMYKDPARY